MPAKITEDRIISMAKQLNIYSTDLTSEELLDAVMDKIEELAKGGRHSWKNANAELVNFYNDAAEEMEKMLEYEGTFF
jgi:hypothetical protein